MGDPHRPDRYGEVWPQGRIDAYLKVLHIIKEVVVISGGWAWHFMAPEGHEELKHAHDHKDVDIFVHPTAIGIVTAHLLLDGFQRVPCRWTNKEFWRYEKHVGKHKLTIDFFVDAEGVPTRKLEGGWRVVEPKYLLSLYSIKHDSRGCFSVIAARKLLEAGTDPVGRPELMEAP